FVWGAAPDATNMYGNGNRTGVEYNIPAVHGGYNLAVKIPWSSIGVSPFNGKSIGFDIEINDNDSGNANKTREATSGWYSTSTQAYNNPSVFGTAILMNCDA